MLSGNIPQISFILFFFINTRVFLKTLYIMHYDKRGGHIGQQIPDKEYYNNAA